MAFKKFIQFVRKGIFGAPVPSTSISPWTALDVGTVGLPGSSALSSGVMTVTGAGADINGTADAFRFVYQTMAGPNATLIARVATISASPTGAGAKATLMVRADTSAGSTCVYIALLPATTGNATKAYHRDGSGTSMSVDATLGASYPEWLKMAVTGQTVVTSYSSDGVTWTSGSTVTLTNSLGANPLIGFGVTSHDVTNRETATFDNISLSGVVPYVMGTMETFWDDAANTSAVGQAAIGGPGITALNGTEAVGMWYDTPRSYIIPLKLPYLAPGLTITAATLDLDYEGIPAGTPTYNVDVYGLARTSTSTTPIPTTADVYTGTNDTANTRLAQNFITPSTTTGPLTLSTPALATWLTAQYAAFTAASTPDTADRYVFLRLNVQGTDTSDKYYAIGTAWNLTRANIPNLKITTSGALAAEASRVVFSFMLSTAAFTSAGVFDATTGQLYRTLWSGVPYAAGTSYAAWDGNNDAGTAMSSGTAYKIKVLYHNFTPTWQGVVGNTSSNLTGTGVWKGYDTFQDFAFDMSGNTTLAFCAQGYNEAEPLCNAFSTTAPQVMIQPTTGNSSPYCTCSYVATDGNYVYMAKGAGGYSGPGGHTLTYIYAMPMAMGSFHNFSGGSSITNVQGSQPWSSVCDLDTSLVIGFPSNPAAGATVTLGTTTYTFVTSGLTTANTVLIGANLAASISNLSAAILAGSGAGTTYGTGTVANTAVTSAAAGATTLTTSGPNNYAFQSSMSLTSVLPNPATGLAVQTGGNWLFVAHASLNIVRVFNKSTGAAASTPSFSVTSPGRVTCDTSGNLWVISGTSILKYSINASTGAATLVYTISSNLVQPLGLSIQPNGTYLIVTDGGSSMQVKFFNATTGAYVFAYGTAGGLPVNGPTVNSSSYWFDNTPSSGCACAPDSTFWVIDILNFRALHYSVSGTTVTYIEQIHYVGVSYACTADITNPNRVFNSWLEYQIDYTKTLDNGVNGSWALVKNWYCLIDPTHYSGQLSSGFRSVCTFTNGLTYTWIFNTPSSQWECWEIQASALRNTGVTRGSGAGYPIINPDMSLTLTNATAGAGPFAPTKAPLNGYTGSGVQNPNWTTFTAICNIALSGGPDWDTSADGWNEQLAVTTGTGVYAMYDGGSNYGYHLAGFLPGATSFQFRCFPTMVGNGSYSGKFPADGRFDAGNSQTYSGTFSQNFKNLIICGHRGENWKSNQAPIFTVFDDNGLFVRNFGTLGQFVVNNAAVAGFAGNPLAPIVTVDANGNGYLFVNDESNHGGLSRWALSTPTTGYLNGTGTIGQLITLS